jgi:hypothetical protein
MAELEEVMRGEEMLLDMMERRIIRKRGRKRMCFIGRMKRFRTNGEMRRRIGSEMRHEIGNSGGETLQ